MGLRDLWDRVAGCAKWWEWVLGAFLTLFPLVASFSITMATRSDDATAAYRNGGLRLPGFAPPPWLFGPMWSVLYILMGLGSFLVYLLGEGLNEATVPALLLYAFQLCVNFAWSPTFFVQGNLAAALLLIGAIWGLIWGCVAAFGRVSWVAAALLVPYLAWVSLASALNYEVVRLNGVSFDFSNYTLPNGTVVSSI